MNITQESGGVFVILRSKRKLDPYVFGTPEAPRALAGTPGTYQYFCIPHEGTKMYGWVIVSSFD